jgi:hypothetical protein
VFTVAEAPGTSSDTSLVVKLLGQEAYLTRRDSYGSAELTLYASPQGIDGFSTQQPLDVTLGEDIALVGYSLSERDLKPGEILRVTLFWQAQDPVDGDYRVFLYLLDSGGAVVGWTEGEPGGGSWPTTVWRRAETVADNHGLLIPTHVVPGRYELVVGMYLVETGDRLPAYRANEEIGVQALLEAIRISP